MLLFNCGSYIFEIFFNQQYEGKIVDFPEVTISKIYFCHIKIGTNFNLCQRNYSLNVKIVS